MIKPKPSSPDLAYQIGMLEQVKQQNMVLSNQLAMERQVAAAALAKAAQIIDNLKAELESLRSVALETDRQLGILIGDRDGDEG